MSIRKIVGFILIAILLKHTDTCAQDSIQWTKGVRIGCDLSRFMVQELQSGRKGMEFSVDNEFKANKFATAEFGIEQISVDNDRVTYKSNGYYGRVGLDFNILKRDKLEKGRDIVFVGFRYGYSHVQHQTDRYVIPSFYSNDTVVGNFSSKNLYGNWLEVAFGLKVEVLKNVFMGASVRGKLMLLSKKDVNYPYYFPGFGKGANSVNFGVNYSIYYQIPLKTVIPTKVKKIKSANQ